MSFYLTLPSNVKSSGVANTTSHYRTILPDGLELTGGDWFVGLAEIQYPYSWRNVGHSEEDCIIQLRYAPTGTLLKVTIPPDFYDIRGLLLTIDNEIRTVVGKQLEKDKLAAIPPGAVDTSLGLNTSDRTAGTQRVSIRLRRRDFISGLQFSPFLSYVLGFKNEMMHEAKNIAAYPPNLSGGFTAMYVYCDCVAPQLIGDIKAPLLRVVPVSQKVKYGSVLTKIYHTPHYLPVMSNSMHSISVSLRNDSDQTVKFSFGKAIVKLHFLRKHMKTI